MPERYTDPEINNPEALLQAAQKRFGVDLSDHGAVFAKTAELASASRRSGNYDDLNRLTELHEQYLDATDQLPKIKKAA